MPGLRWRRAGWRGRRDGVWGGRRGLPPSSHQRRRLGRRRRKGRGGVERTLLPGRRRRIKGQWERRMRPGGVSGGLPGPLPPQLRRRLSGWRRHLDKGEGPWPLRLGLKRRRRRRWTQRGVRDRQPSQTPVPSWQQRALLCASSATLSAGGKVISRSISAGGATARRWPPSYSVTRRRRRFRGSSRSRRPTPLERTWTSAPTRTCRKPREE